MLMSACPPLQMLHKSAVHRSTAPVPSKQAFLPLKHGVVTSNTSYHDYTNSKYADLFITPPPNPNMYSFDAALPAYPLDTMIPSYPPPQPQKAQDSGLHFTRGKTAPSELENLLTKTPAAATDLENVLKMPESDVSSLLALFTPSNTDPQEGLGDFAIPSTTMGIFDSFPTDIFQEALAAPQQPMDTWRDVQAATEGKPLPASLEQLPSEPSQDPASFWMSSSSPSQLTPLLEAFTSLDCDVPLPTPSFSPPSHSAHLHTPSFSPPSHSAHLHTPSVSPTNSLSTSSSATIRMDRLSFEDQLDFFDGVLDLDGILPPSKKFHEYPPLSHSEASSPMSHMHVSPTPTPTPSSPPTPADTKEDIKPIFTSPLASPEPASEKAKPSPLLFGKHEDDILLKVLVRHPGLNSKPVTRDKLISMPVEEFNRLLEAVGLNDIEMAFMKEWRRRGKNKTAAMVARKRKREELSGLDLEVEQLRKQKAGLQAKYDRLRSDIVALRERTRTAEERVYRRYSRQNSVPVSRETHMIHVDKTNKVLLVPRLSQQMLLVK